MQGAKPVVACICLSVCLSVSLSDNLCLTGNTCLYILGSDEHSWYAKQFPSIGALPVILPAILFAYVKMLEAH